jgi:phenylacetate-CoA ligase
MISYSHLLTRVLQPAWYQRQGRAYGEHLKLLDASQWWPLEKLREFQWTELQPLLKAAFENVPFYQRKYAQAGAQLGDIRSLEDFAKLPPLTREEIRAHREDLVNRGHKGKLIRHATGGSSGSPTHFYITLESYDWRCAASVRAYSWAGYMLGDKALYLWGAPVGRTSTQAAWKMRAFRMLRREHMVSTFHQTPELWQSIHEQARRLRPSYVVGYVSSLEEFSRWMLQNGKRLEGVKAVLSAAEPVYQRSRDVVGEAFGAPLFNTYGSREFMSIGGECDRRDGVHVNMENLLLETSDSGRTGAILVTDLHNFGMPFLRYEIGDVGELSDQPCSCGRGLHRLMRIEGRVLDVLRTPSGAVVPGEFFPHILKDVPEVIEFQVVQKRLDHIVLSLVLTNDLSENSRALLDSEIRKWFGDSSLIELQRVSEIPRRASGKRRVTIGLGQE